MERFEAKKVRQTAANQIVARSAPTRTAATHGGRNLPKPQACSHNTTARYHRNLAGNRRCDGVMIYAAMKRLPWGPQIPFKSTASYLADSGRRRCSHRLYAWFYPALLIRNFYGSPPSLMP
jgi:hypothetical protein